MLISKQLLYSTLFLKVIQSNQELSATELELYPLNLKLLKHHNGTLNNGSGPNCNVTRTPTPNTGSWSGLVGGYGASLSKI